MFTVILTGGICSGKSIISHLFSIFDVPIIDMDIISHNITSRNGIAIPYIIKEFGNSFILYDGSLNRKNMRTLIFSNEKARKALSIIMNRLILKEVENIKKKIIGKYLIIVCPLLAESVNLKINFDYVLNIDCPISSQITRVMQRNGFTLEEALLIINSQASRKERLLLANDIIFNHNLSMNMLMYKVKKLHKKYLILAKNIFNNLNLIKKNISK